MPSIKLPLAKVDTFLKILHPQSIDFNFSNVTSFVDTPFVLEMKSVKMAKSWSDKPTLILKGNFKLGFRDDEFNTK